MASCKVATTKCAYAAITYALKDKENKDLGRPAMRVSGVDCDEDTAFKLFKADRILHDKNSGIQAHIVYQSFNGKECSVAEANKIGLEMAKQLCPGHKAIVVTHGDTKNIHNHIIINSVNFENGRKIDTSGFLNKARRTNEKLCAEHGLSDIRDYVAETRKTRAEQELEAKGIKPWKTEIREAVEDSFAKADSFENFKKILLDEHRIIIDESRGTFKKLDNDRQRIRGKRLGADYTLDNIKKELGERNNKKEVISDKRDYVAEARKQRSARVSGAIAEIKSNRAAQAAMELQKVTSRAIEDFTKSGKVAITHDRILDTPEQEERKKRQRDREMGIEWDCSG